MLHWAIAVPYVICWLTALVLVLVYNQNPLLPSREVFGVIHRVAAIGLIILPGLVMLKNRKDYRIHLYNIKCAWLWSLNDLKWLALMGLAVISRKIVLPEQEKFNAAEKVNFMSVMVACPIFILTGLMIWTQTVAWAAWLVHGVLALLVTPTMLGHIYMATVNPDTRKGISGMISGYVDRQWARHHYGLWYKERFEQNVQTGIESRHMIHPPDHRVHIHCPSCSENIMVTWGWLLQQVFSARDLSCPSCGATVSAIATVTNQQELEWIKRQFEANRVRSSPAA
jgi:formate dehydrogenase gamma subunit